jgi:hypothetical protein
MKRRNIGFVSITLAHMLCSTVRTVCLLSAYYTHTHTHTHLHARSSQLLLSLLHVWLHTHTSDVMFCFSPISPDTSLPLSISKLIPSFSCTHTHSLSLSPSSHKHALLISRSSLSLWRFSCVCVCVYVLAPMRLTSLRELCSARHALHGKGRERGEGRERCSGWEEQKSHSIQSFVSRWFSRRCVHVCKTTMSHVCNTSFFNAAFFDFFSNLTIDRELLFFSVWKQIFLVMLCDLKIPIRQSCFEKNTEKNHCWKKRKCYFFGVWLQFESATL